MAGRYGRNQRRRARELIAELDARLNQAAAAVATYATAAEFFRSHWIEAAKALAVATTTWETSAAHPDAFMIPDNRVRNFRDETMSERGIVDRRAEIDLYGNETEPFMQELFRRRARYDRRFPIAWRGAAWMVDEVSSQQDLDDGLYATSRNAFGRRSSEAVVTVRLAAMGQGGSRRP
jgi:hypothetical protein